GVANLQTIDRRGLRLHSRGTHEGRAFQGNEEVGPCLAGLGTIGRFYQASCQAKSAIYPGGRALGGADITTQMAQRKIHIMAVSTSELGATLRDWRERVGPGGFGGGVFPGREGPRPGRPG